VARHDPAVTTSFQPSLFGTHDVSFDASYATVERIHLDDNSWIDFAPAWVSGSDVLFEQVLASRRWAQRTRRMYEGRVPEPRLTAPWNAASGTPLEPGIVDELRLSLSRRYGILFDSVGFNFYRDGRDSVAWHGDKIRKEIADPIVALVSLGEPRKFLLRPRGGGRSRAWQLGHGDLLVTGGRTQREYEHSIPKVARAGPRISLAFRYGMDVRAYGREDAAERSAAHRGPGDQG
jgi:alkylated DNA repair dioxygenase AlkB